MADIKRRRRPRRRHTAMHEYDMLSFHERKLVRDLEMRHGVIIKSTTEGVEARHWRTDEIIVEAEDVQEMEVVLRSMHVYPDPEEEATP